MPRQAELDAAVGFDARSGIVRVLNECWRGVSDVEQQVEDVRTHVDEHAAARLASPHPGQCREVPRVGVADFRDDVDEVADLAGVERGTEQADGRQQASKQSDRVDDAALRRRVDHPRRVVQ